MRWAGKTVAVIGSGPSLTARDCTQIEAAGIPTIAINSSWKLARFCTAIYAGDKAWWANNISAIDIDAERWTCLENAATHYGLSLHGKTRSTKVSGLRAIEMAIDHGATRVLLLGFDCSVSRGIHWHGRHANSGNPDHNRCKKWLQWFAELATRAQVEGVEIINCSRETALTCFERMPLETALREYR